MNNDILNHDKLTDAQIPPIPEIPPIPPVNPLNIPLVVGSVQSFQHNAAQLPPALPAYSTHNPLELNMEYVLSRIDMILKDTSHIHKALDTITCIEPSDSESSGGMSDAGRAEAVTAAVQSRETTNQQMLKLLEKMYDDLKSKEKGLKERAFDMAERIMNNATLTIEEKNQLLDVFDSIRHIES